MGLSEEKRNEQAAKYNRDLIAKLSAELDEVKLAANSLLGLIDCLGGRMSLDDAGSDRKSLAELVDYPEFMNRKIKERVSASRIDC